MKSAAQLPTTPANSGVLTKKPLPMIEASGVTVACQPDNVRSRLERAKYAASAKVTRITLFNMR